MEKGQINMNKEIAIFYCQVVHCPGARGRKVNRVKGVLEKLVAILHLINNKNRLLEGIALVPDTESKALKFLPGCKILPRVTRNDIVGRDDWVPLMVPSGLF